MAPKVGFIGGGNMAKALAFGMIKNNALKAEDIYVSGPHVENLKPWRDAGVTNISTSNFETVTSCDIIFICVKPYIFGSMAAELESHFDKTNVSMTYKVWVSIMAGVTLKKLTESLGFYSNPKIVRTIPNTPVEVGAGIIVYSCGPGVTPNDKTELQTILKSVAMAEEVPENLINSVSALAGSGPAYVYLVIEALADGGVKMGIPRDMASQFAAQTVMGAAQMVSQLGRHPGALKDEVCSAGGSTIAGLHELEKGAVRSSFINAVQAAKMRGDEIGKSN